MTINELLALAGLTASDEIPVWDAEGQVNGRTKKITAQNLAASIKTIASLIASSDLDTTPTSGSTKAVQSGGVYDAIQQSTANNLGTSTDLSSYTPGNLFTLPNDGYIVYNIPVNGYLGFRVYGASNNYFSLIPSSDDSGSLFMRKGMRIDVRTISTGTSIAFYPLII